MAHANRTPSFALRRMSQNPPESGCRFNPPRQTVTLDLSRKNRCVSDRSSAGLSKQTHPAGALQRAVQFTPAYRHRPSLGPSQASTCPIRTRGRDQPNRCQSHDPRHGTDQTGASFQVQQKQSRRQMLTAMPWPISTPPCKSRGRSAHHPSVYSSHPRRSFQPVCTRHTDIGPGDNGSGNARASARSRRHQPG